MLSENHNALRKDFAQGLGHSFCTRSYTVSQRDLDLAKALKSKT